MNTNTSKRSGRAAIVATIVLLLCSATEAQAVHKCRVDGRLVYQSSPCAAEPRVVASASATPPAAAVDTAPAPKKKSLADLLRERDGADRDRPQTREFQGDGANVLRSRMGAV